MVNRQTVVNPHGLAGAFLARNGYLRALSGQELDDVWADALGAVAWALHTWRPDGGRSFASWAWQVMGRDVPRAQRRRWRQRLDLTVDGDPLDMVFDAAGRWPRACAVVEDGYAQVDARDQLARIARWAALTDAEAEAAETMAVHGGTITRHLGGRARWFPGTSDQVQGPYGGALRKLRAAARARDEWWQHRQEGAA